MGSVRRTSDVIILKELKAQSNTIGHRVTLGTEEHWSSGHIGTVGIKER